jgi:ABC-2 type transport system ATP-binding protein
VSAPVQAQQAVQSPGADVPSVEIEDLVRDFGKGKTVAHAVRGISLHVGRGEIFGLVGPDGAGKTTTLRMIAGLITPTSGKVRVLGVDPFGRGGGEVRQVLGLVPQEHSLYGDLSIAENLAFFGELFGLSRAVFEERKARLLGITRLTAFTDRRAAQLSGGMYKKLSVSCALLHQPEVLLLDEPTNGVDPVSRRELWQLLYELSGRGMSVIVSTPYMDEAVRCHRVALLSEGKVLRTGEPNGLARGFDGLVAEIVGGDRERLHAALDAFGPGLLASSPAGVRLRVVAEHAARPRLEALAHAEGATLEPAEPDFEDLFLAELERARLQHHAQKSAA